MYELLLARYVLDCYSARLVTAPFADRGDVAEKVVIVGIFVVLALAVGAIITSAVTSDAHKIARTVSGEGV